MTHADLKKLAESDELASAIIKARQKSVTVYTTYLRQLIAKVLGTKKNLEK